MPLLDDGGRLIGVIGATELLAAMVHRGASEPPPDDEEAPAGRSGAARTMKGTTMVRRVRRPALFLLALMVAPAASAHYVDLNQALHSRNTLTVGIALTGQPFAYKRDGVVRGFEVEMAQAVAEAHGLALEVVRPCRAPSWRRRLPQARWTRPTRSPWRRSRRASRPCPIWWSAIT